ncbi:MAG: hypothetical protein ABSE73_22690, partial [Planctomycetota bacterium]
CRRFAAVVAGGCALLVLGLPLLIAGLLGAMRLVLITFFFARYSLRQMLAVILTGGSLVTLLVKLSGGWMAIPIAGLIGLATLVGYYIAAQDPEGPGFTPRFIKRVLEARQHRENSAANHPEEAAPLSRAPQPAIKWPDRYERRAK